MSASKKSKESTAYKSVSRRIRVQAFHRTIAVIDDLVDPGRKPEAMDREDYKLFLEELIGDLQIRLDAAVQEDHEASRVKRDR